MHILAGRLMLTRSAAYGRVDVLAERGREPAVSIPPLPLLLAARPREAEGYTVLPDARLEGSAFLILILAIMVSGPYSRGLCIRSHILFGGLFCFGG